MIPLLAGISPIFVAASQILRAVVLACYRPLTFPKAPDHGNTLVPRPHAQSQQGHDGSLGQRGYCH
ncbi:MAG: hypothetical protein ACI9HY_000890 [Planctomycetaceae bacterium]|jgi:hypothetical protein